MRFFKRKADDTSRKTPASHKGHAVGKAIRNAGAALIFLPKYSPNLNPIEHVFAKLKHLLRNATARTLPAIQAFPPPNVETTLSTQDMAELKVIML
jgi:transposase